MHQSENFRCWLGVMAVALLAFIIITILLIVNGLFDPHTKDSNQISLPATTLTIKPKSTQIVWQVAIPAPPYSIRLNAVLQRGEVDSGYGLMLGKDDDHFGIAVAPTGYLTLWQTGKQDIQLLPWQTWPHVQTEHAHNEIWLDVAADGMVTIRVNREVLWSGDIAPLSGEIGIYGESFGETAVIDYQTPNQP